MDNREFWIRLPFPPSLNSIIGMRRPDKYWTMTKERAAQVAFSLAGEAPITGGVAIRYFYKKNDLRRYDIENCSKAICDGFSIGGLWIDDYQIDDSHAVRMPVSPDAGYVDIHIRVISERPLHDVDTDRMAKVDRSTFADPWTLERPKKRKKSGQKVVAIKK